MKIFLIAGEESGDILGAELMSALQGLYKKEDIVFRGIGGSRMEKTGLKSLFPMEELSLMGIAEIVPKIPSLLKRIKQTVNAIEVFQPDVLITIDSPDFCFRVAKRVKDRQIDISFKAHYVAPTVWAWRPRRAENLAGLYDGVMCLFPFEPPYFEKEGMKARFVGHPMSHLLADIKTSTFMKKNKLGKKILKLGVLFGSRESEVNRMAPVFLESIENILKEETDVCVISPTLPPLKGKVEELLRDLPCRTLVITDPDDKYRAMKSCDIALATSGTAGLELSVLNVPHVIAYKISSITYEIGRRLITTKYAHLTNIMLQKPIVPEFIQKDANAEAISSSLIDLLYNNDAKLGQLSSFDTVRDYIQGAEKDTPSERCAKFVMDNINAS